MQKFQVGLLGTSRIANYKEKVSPCRGLLSITHLVCFTQPIIQSLKRSRVGFIVPRVKSCPLQGLKGGENQRSVRSGMKFVEIDGMVLARDKYPFIKVGTCNTGIRDVGQIDFA